MREDRGQRTEDRGQKTEDGQACRVPPSVVRPPSSVFRLRGVTVTELVIAVSLMTVIVGVMAPLLHAVQSSWRTREGDCESLANARAFIHHFRQQVSQASRVTSASDHLTTNGYLQFIASDDSEFRYEIDGGDDIQFGPVGTLADLAGPADSLRFTCYDANDLGTPITDGNSIDVVRVDVAFRNAASAGRSHALSTTVYIRASNADEAGDEEVDTFQPGVAMLNKIEWYDGFIDSYRSSQGAYNPSQHGSGAIVSVNATGNSKIVLSGSAMIYGDAYIGPGGSVDSGIKTWGSSQITGSRGTLDEAISIPILSAPTGPPFSGSHEGTLQLWGTMTTTVNSNRYFHSIALSGSSKLIISGDVTILLNNRLEMSNSTEVQVLAGSSLRLYVGHNVGIWGTSKINTVTTDPGKLRLYMIGNNRSFEMTDSAQVCCVLQNPAGPISIWTNSQFFGRMRAKQLTGNGKLHIDLDSGFE